MKRSETFAAALELRAEQGDDAQTDGLALELSCLVDVHGAKAVFEALARAANDSADHLREEGAAGGVLTDFAHVATACTDAAKLFEA